MQAFEFFSHKHMLSMTMWPPILDRTRFNVVSHPANGHDYCLQDDIISVYKSCIHIFHMVKLFDPGDPYNL